MKLYLISQTVLSGYDTYSDAVVAANSEEEAKTIHPGMNFTDEHGPQRLTEVPHNSYDSWPGETKYISAKLIGEAIEGTELSVICASFHAG